MPVRILRRHQLQHRLILLNLALKRFRRIRIQIHMRIRMIPHWLRRRPQLQCLRRIGIPFEFSRIDESIGRRHVPLLQHRQRIPRNLHPRHSRRQLPIQRQIIKRNRHLLRSTHATEEK